MKKKNKIDLIILTTVLALSVGGNVYGFIGGKDTQLKVSKLEENFDKVAKEKEEVENKFKETTEKLDKTIEDLIATKTKLDSESKKLTEANNKISELEKEKASTSQKEKEDLKATLRTYIFDEYMSGPNYVYAKGINWSGNYYDNLTAEEIWNTIEDFKKKNGGKEGTLFDQASYLSQHAPIKDNWKELFLENWNRVYPEVEIDKNN